MQLRTFVIVLVCLFALVFSLPTIDNNQYLPEWLQSYQIKLGLDIKGGASVLLEVDTDSILYDKLLLAKSDLSDNLQGKYKSIEIRDKKIIVTLYKDQTNTYDTYNNFFVQKIANQLHFVPDDIFISQANKLAVDTTISILSKRLDAIGINDISVYKYGTGRIIVQVPGTQNIDVVKNLIGKTAKLGFHLVHLQSKNFKNPPRGFMVLPVIGQDKDHYLVSNYPLISGSNLLDSQVLYEQGKPVVAIRFDHIGANKFAKVTQEYLNHQLAIVLDQEVISAPVINNVITSGSAVISGNFSLQDANELAIMLASGSLPAPVNILEERVVGPGLAVSSIQSGMLASYIALGFVVVFMILLYGWMGVFANLGLLINVLLIISLLVLIQATLTLPGIVGLLLTIDMAVDSNVLIFERIQEEYQRTKNLLLSINNGYKLATSTIMDSHITTLITALVLFLLGSGPIQGFAITLGLGVFTSIFVAKVLTKILILNWYYYYGQSS